jgi:hypothetical protein
VRCRPGFFLPVRVLRRLFRGKLLAFLAEAYRAGRLQFHGRLVHLQNPRAFRSLLADARSLEWVVYAKPPFGGPDAVLKYLARYTHRIAISNQRLLNATDDHVSFRWKDYRHGHRSRVMTLEIAEFARRFLLHVLPPRFVKIRYYGLLAQSQRSATLPQCRELLDAPPNVNAAASESGEGETNERDNESITCPHCQHGRLVYVRALPPADSS